MTARTEHPIDRSGWPPGPWDSEPDRLEWTHVGLPCLLARNYGGAWCGYVGVPPEHPLHGKQYNQLELAVHGGLTYSRHCHEHICHTPAPGIPEAFDTVWWLGFDTAHLGDLLPGVPLKKVGLSNPFHGIYRDLAYCRAETESLAEQISAWPPRTPTSPQGARSGDTPQEG